MQGFWLALSFLTRLPVPDRAEANPISLSGAAIWFPVVGLLLGGLIALAAGLGAHEDPWLGALLALLIWVLATGGLHLDGLADLFDALGAAHRDRARFLAVLADPHLGAFGAMALMLQLIAKLVLLMLLLKVGSPLWLLVLVPAWARLGALWWLRTLPPLKSGLAASFAGTGIGAWPWIWLALLLSFSWFAPLLMLAPLLIVAWQGYLRARVGGMNGDCLGAGVELLESAALLLLSGQRFFASV